MVYFSPKAHKSPIARLAGARLARKTSYWHRRESPTQNPPHPRKRTPNAPRYGNKPFLSPRGHARCLQTCAATLRWARSHQRPRHAAGPAPEPWNNRIPAASLLGAGKGGGCPGSSGPRARSGARGRVPAAPPVPGLQEAAVAAAGPAGAARRAGRSGAGSQGAALGGPLARLLLRARGDAGAGVPVRGVAGVPSLLLNATVPSVAKGSAVRPGCSPAVLVQ